MQHPHTGRRLLAGTALAALAMSAAGPARAQVAMTDRAPASVERHLDRVRAYLADMHGPVAERLWETHASRLGAPHELPLPPRAPAVPAAPGHIEALALLHYQAVAGTGSLGRLHGSTANPVGLAWFPHSMYAQGGGMYARWGFAHLLEGVDRFVTLQTG